jgi:hypothetical protein
MGKLQAMKTFLRVVEGGSFLAVALESDTAQSAVSKQVAAPERELGAGLLTRTTHCDSHSQTWLFQRQKPFAEGQAVFLLWGARSRSISLEASIRFAQRLVNIIDCQLNGLNAVEHEKA